MKFREAISSLISAIFEYVVEITGNQYFKQFL